MNDISKFTETEKKKALYKQNPTAEKDFIRNGYKHYSTEVVFDGVEEEIGFNVPLSEMGESEFPNEIEAKFLIRWMDKDE